MEREIVWGKMGTPCRIVKAEKAEVLVKVKGEWVPAKADLSGRVAIDEPTLNYYRGLHERYGHKEAKDGEIIGRDKGDGM